MFYLKSLEKKDCFGCTACIHVCPVKCISMYNDNEGFRYPKKDETLCTECNLCEQVCPNINEILDEHLDEIESFSLVHNDENMLLKSSSGGAFSAIAEAYCDKNYAIFGVEIDSDFKIKHSYVLDINEIGKFRKSKYVQSDLNSSYNDAKKMLESGMKVLFTGTPCQIAGLKLYLKKEYGKLLCVDIVCHGVPSQKVFNEYLKDKCSKPKYKIQNISFRHKTNVGDKWESRNIRIAYGERIVIEDNRKNSYLKGFHQGLFYRLSCYECKYANPNRVGDITIGDFWSVQKVFPKENPHKGVSEIIVNTQKGKNIIERLKENTTLKSVSLKVIIKYTGQLNIPTMTHPKRELFFDNLESENFDILVNQCISKNFIRGKLRRILSVALPRGVKYKIKKILRS